MVYQDLWIQADFGRNVVAEGVVTQGRHNTDQWVTSYRVKYKKDGEDHFQTVLDKDNQPKVIFVFIQTEIFLISFILLK